MIATYARIFRTNLWGVRVQLAAGESFPALDSFVEVIRAADNAHIREKVTSVEWTSRDGLTCIFQIDQSINASNRPTRQARARQQRTSRSAPASNQYSGTSRDRGNGGRLEQAWRDAAEEVKQHPLATIGDVMKEAEKEPLKNREMREHAQRIADEIRETDEVIDSFDV